MFQFRTNNESDREDGGLCSHSEQTRRVAGEDGGLCSSSEQTRIVTGRMVGCVPVQNKQG